MDSGKPYFKYCKHVFCHMTYFLTTNYFFVFYLLHCNKSDSWVCFWSSFSHILLDNIKYSQIGPYLNIVVSKWHFKKIGKLKFWFWPQKDDACICTQLYPSIMQLFFFLGNFMKENPWLDGDTSYFKYFKHAFCHMTYFWTKIYVCFVT